MLTTHDFSVLGIQENPDSLTCISSYIFNGQRFSILISESPPPGYSQTQALELDILDRLDELASHDGTDDSDMQRQHEYQKQLSHEIGALALPVMQRIAPFPVSPNGGPSGSAGKTVEQYLYPSHVPLQLVTVDGRLSVIEGHHSDVPSTIMPISREQLADITTELDSLATYPASQVYLGNRYTTGASAFDASIYSEEFVVKITSIFTQHAILAELKRLCKIKRSRFDSTIRVSQLKGLVTYGDGFVGFLLEKIPSKFTTLDPVMEGKAGEVTLSTKRKWMAQIENTVAELHKKNIIWGDAKPGNIIIDTDDNAWLIDFGGGFTEPWVGLEQYETREGDLQALKRIRDILQQE